MNARPTPHRPPVMADVAARAGVSHQTVSRVLNSPGLVRPATRERVRRAIADLGYRRNLSARALATNRSQLIGVVTPGVTLFGPSHATTAIQHAARAAGYASVTAAIEDATANPHDVLEFFLDLRVDGIVVVAPTVRTAEAAHELAVSLPVVIISADQPTSGPLHLVTIDHRQGARDATAHLIGLGHRHIAHVAGPADWFEARARVEGWRFELLDAGLPTLDVVEGGWDAGQGYEAGQRLLGQRDVPTAVFAANDHLALGLLRAFADAGRCIPDDVAVVGYDDVPGSAFYAPSLTTVRQPFDDVGRQAIETLLAVLAGNVPDPTSSRPELVVRASSGPHVPR
ncbi:LacI family DNA-binding transcriptional regulator [Georgenia satyanarayanai]|uniref:LacI family DNA-binding transcriptional regulator n=1 Tax=Georgenia satyanarayanai TaxID=860221 RepID=UPI00203A78FD|nr:LacI family DNA-binding transcriptional regulator [Georgenia satyanarayanai]MCM3661432.1 LacI family DNA-binding transcriptional regulator [Georgenia satyanarayanai]